MAATTTKTIAVVIETSVVARAREALRGAIGLTLRGDDVIAVLPVDLISDDPGLVRHRTMLAEFGHTVTCDPNAAAAADVTVVWTDSSRDRILQLTAGPVPREIALADLAPNEIIDLIFEYDAAVVL